MEDTAKIALVHDWLVGMRGGEKVLEVLCQMYPQATLFTLVHREGACSPSIERMKIVTSFIQHSPFGRDRYQYYLPLFPRAVRGFDLRGFDLVVSSSSAAAKGVTPGPGALHLCYCHTPMRYLWDQYEQYFGPGRAPLAVRGAMRLVRGYLRQWDVASARGVHSFIANSVAVQERIRRLYGRDAVVIYPPVDVHKFRPSSRDEGYYLIVSALVPYKRLEIAVEAFALSGRRLVVVGSGPEERRLKAKARGNIEFPGWVSDEELRQWYACCRGLIFPGEEDFGIVPVEAMACGKPVIALARGGALETVIEGETGIFFERPDAILLNRAIDRFETMRFDPGAIAARVQHFRTERYRDEIAAFVRGKLEERRLRDR